MSEPDPMARAARKRAERERRAQEEGPPPIMRQIGQIGMLGWMIVAPTLIGLFLGRFIDREFGTGIFFSAPLMMVGVAAGGWTAWRWMHRQ